MAASPEKNTPDQVENNPPAVEEEKILVEWKAYSRPFKTFRKEFYINLGSIFALFGLILFVVEGVLPAVLVAAIFFIFYVFTTVEPEKIDYKLTTYGIKFSDHRLFWEELGRYWFAKRFDSTVLIVETATAPWKMEFVVDENKKDEIRDIISKYLYFNDTPPSLFEKATNWVSSKLRM